MKQSRSKRLSPLGKYLWEQRYSDRDFADRIKIYRALPRFSPSTVENWRYGTRNPQGENLKAVMALTGMTADQILGLDGPWARRMTVSRGGTTTVYYRSKRTGDERVYYYDYYRTAEERALATLKKRPLRRVGYRWTAGQRGPVFNDATIVRLIQKGLAVCLGDVVELKGKVR